MFPGKNNKSYDKLTYDSGAASINSENIELVTT